MEIVNKRKYPRIPLKVAAKFQLFSSGNVISEQWDDGEIVNISASGIALFSTHIYPEGSMIAINFKLGGKVNFDQLIGKIVRIDKKDNGDIMGIQFVLEPDKDKNDIVEKYVNTLRFLKQVEIFKSISIDELKYVENIGIEERFSSGKIIFSEGMEANDLYIVISGIVKITKKSTNQSQEETLAMIREGEVFGEMAVLDDYTRSATAIAHKDSVLLRIKKMEFRQLVESHTELTKKLLWIFIKTLCKRLREADKRISDSFIVGTPLSSEYYR